MNSRRPVIVVAVVFILILAACSGGQPEQTTSSSGARASITNKGSDTMVNLALAWAERYQSLHPDLLVSVTGGGSGTGLTALINHTVDIANVSRAIKPEEIQAMKSAGAGPVEFVVARDAIAVIVYPGNPVDQLSMQQIADIYSGKIDNWKDVGGEDRPIVRLSRETNSGTHVYFLEEVLRLGKKGDKTLFSPNTLLLPSSEGITAEVSENPNAIGYDGLGYITPNVKVLAVARSGDGPFVLPSVDTVNNSSYPIARDLYMYTSGEPQGPEKAYLDWIMSAEAQGIVQQLGFVPIVVP